MVWKQLTKVDQNVFLVGMGLSNVDVNSVWIYILLYQLILNIGINHFISWYGQQRFFINVKFLSVNFAPCMEQKTLTCMCYSLINIFGISIFDKPVSQENEKQFFGKYFLLNGHVYYQLFISDNNFMAQDVIFVILNSFHDLLLFNMVYVKQAILLYNEKSGVVQE